VYLPSGWLLAQLAVTEGSTLAGRWLQRGALATQIAAWKLDVRLCSPNCGPQHPGRPRCTALLQQTP
jgi:hypothetical protein